MVKINLAEKNGMWKGDKAGLDAIHIWVIARKFKPKRCECCNKMKRLDLANISQKYKRNVNDYEWLCRKCHMTKDGRLTSLKEMGAARKKVREVKCCICKKMFMQWHTYSTCCSLSCGARKSNLKRWGRAYKIDSSNRSTGGVVLPALRLE